MNTLVLVSIILIFIFSIWYARKQGVTAAYENKSHSEKIEANPDTPIDFGYKTLWIAVNTTDKVALAKTLALKQIVPANWKSGIIQAQKKKLFLTPSIGEWTLITGRKLQATDSLESLLEIEQLLCNLSSTFGEAQFFETHRVSECHCWMKSQNGKMLRTYAYWGDTGKTIKVAGALTKPERELNLFDSNTYDTLSPIEQAQIEYADEELVLRIAESWSVNPSNLSDRSDIKKESGFIGY